MGLITSATFMVTIAVSKRFFENRLLGVLRVILMLVVGIRLFRMMDLPYLVSGTGSADTTVLTHPASCFIQGNATVSTVGISEAEKNTTRDMHVAKYLDVALSLTLIICVAGRLLQSISGQFWVTNVSRSCYVKVVFHSTQWVVLVFGTVIIIYCCTTIIKLRRYMDSLGPLHENNPENNIKSFGQFIPLVLLALIPLAILETTFERYKEKHEEFLETGFRKRMFWLIFLGPKRSDWEALEDTELPELRRVHARTAI
ncbi:hypothetical protein LTR56_002190 [Elasticomyces elasticus]|nr:hypothetical protein LTR56_002190 [Elasticomyces elasticus]KAK3666069.1 hypothetical protein LTR22_003072 [Elasticomyces elasticus]KAK4929556.1 hypothetical protein LTR49_003851 [Elasticomyces elasticus]KAK5767486.1 hypothetical protein LTS12_002327 [Elasticomyces elasticus]